MRRFLSASLLTAVLLILGLGLLPSGCKQTPKPQPPADTVTAVRVVADTQVPPDHFCRTIAGLPTRAVGAKGKFWPQNSTLKIGFMGAEATAAKVAFVKQTLQKWQDVINLTLSYPATGPYDIRITFKPGYGSWSYIGTDAKAITNQINQTINLAWLDEQVVLHEFGHALGLMHEQQNPNGAICWNRDVVIRDLSGPPNNWTVVAIENNVLNPLNPANVITTPLDPVSIMMYMIPSTWVCNGVGFPGGKTLSAQDVAFIKGIYPKTTPPPPPPPPADSSKVVLTKIQAAELLRRMKVSADSATAVYNYAKKALGQ